MKFLITGGAGFIGSEMIRHLIGFTDHSILNIDKLTYAGNLDSLKSIFKNDRYDFINCDISNKDAISNIFETFEPDVVMNFAAESHVDRSIDNSGIFISTNINGTYNLLETSLSYWLTLKGSKKYNFRFHQISTDEVYGSLGSDGLFKEDSPYKPNSPYSASKASADHLVRAWYKTYSLPILLTNCSNNYGPYQFPEKLIPLIILNAIEKKELPIYGSGENIRDWIFVNDHVKALYEVVRRGKIGETYNIGGNNEKTNLDVVTLICEQLDIIKPLDNVSSSYKDKIVFVKDRPGHDLRYSIDNTKITTQLGWSPKVNFNDGIKTTIEWYLKNPEWCNNILNNNHIQRQGILK